jgi:hypothetical protein
VRVCARDYADKHTKKILLMSMGAPSIWSRNGSPVGKSGNELSSNKLLFPNICWGSINIVDTKNLGQKFVRGHKNFSGQTLFRVANLWRLCRHMRRKFLLMSMGGPSRGSSMCRPRSEDHQCGRIFSFFLLLCRCY